MGGPIKRFMFLGLMPYKMLSGRVSGNELDWSRSAQISGQRVVTMCCGDRYTLGEIHDMYEFSHSDRGSQPMLKKWTAKEGSELAKVKVEEAKFMTEPYESCRNKFIQTGIIPEYCDTVLLKD